MYKKSRGINSGISQTSLERIKKERPLERQLTRKQTLRNTMINRRTTIRESRDEENHDQRPRSLIWGGGEDLFIGSKGYIEDLEAVKDFFGELGLLSTGPPHSTLGAL